MNIWDILCSSRKYQYLSPPPPPPRRTTEIQREWGRGGEGVSRRRQFPRSWEVASRVFFLGALRKIDEQAISYSGGSREGGPLLFVDQTETLRAKLFMETRTPPYLRVWMSTPPISNSGSGTVLFYFWMVFQSKRYCFHWRSVICGWLSAFFMACMTVHVGWLLATNE